MFRSTSSQSGACTLQAYRTPLDRAQRTPSSEVRDTTPELDKWGPTKANNRVDVCVEWGLGHGEPVGHAPAPESSSEHVHT
jgi:hypothetical protein